MHRRRVQNRRRTQEYRARASQQEQQQEEQRIPRHDLGQMDRRCAHCGALTWHTENKTMCCCNGQVVLPPLQPPPEFLQNLLLGESAESRHFRDNIRGYNSALAFASLGANEDVLPPGVYCFRISGEVHHRIGHLLPQQNSRPRFAQLYIHDTDNEAANRIHWNSALQEDVLLQLQDLLHQVNPYVQVYKHANTAITEAGERGCEVRLVLRADSSKDSRRYNLPQASEVAVILPDAPFDQAKRDIVLYRRVNDDPRGLHLIRISETHPQYDPLHYVLLFPFGEEGWNIRIPFVGNRNGQVSPMQFYAYRLMDRGDFNLILFGGRLLQQYVVDQYAKMELQRLRFLRDNQGSLRAEMYQGLNDAVVAGDIDGTTVGRKIVLPATFVGSPRNMIQLYQDAMAIVRRFGKPDLFITFTCNPNWPEIRNALKPQQTPADRPDLVARVFKMKVDAFMKDLVAKKLFGAVMAHVRVVEFQKRGLPHVHILLILDPAEKPRSAEDVNKIVKAELPPSPALRALVEKHMIHGPCGNGFPNSPCMKDNSCSKEFPKKFSERTVLTDNTYPTYQRRDDGSTVEKNGAILDNRWVVPYNPFLLYKYEAHINVEVCNSITAVKYLYKYVYKGHDRILVEFHHNNNDEIKNFIDARYVSASEACWRLFHFDMQERYPAIQRLAVHLPNQQTLVYREGHAQQAINNIKDTTLTGWFKANGTFPEARELYYFEMPEKFTWNSSNASWKIRQRKTSLGRLFNACPSEGERFYLRILLQYIKGAQSFEQLRTLPDGTVCPTFRDAALRRGLLQDDQEWMACLGEAAATATPAHMRQLFAIILIFGEPSSPLALWNEFHRQLCQDFLHRKFGHNIPPSDDECSNAALLHLKALLLVHKKEPDDFGLPHPHGNIVSSTEHTYDRIEESTAASEMLRQLNRDQQRAYIDIITAIDFHDVDDMDRLFFIDGPGGSGKTFLYNALISQVRGRGEIAIAVASSGIASELLKGGRTAHSVFKIPIPIQDHSTCSITRQSERAKMIMAAKLIVWDEAPMMDRRVFECVSRTLCDLLNDARPFGGKVVVLGGDFRQILPVVRRGGEADIINATLNRSSLWHHFSVLHLHTNMRANDADSVNFAKWLRDIGDGTMETLNNIGESTVKMPEHICLPANNIEALVTAIFPDLDDMYTDEAYLAERAILTTTNDNVDIINDRILARIPTQEHIYFSADSIDDQQQSAVYPTEFLNSLNIAGVASHKLILKKNTPVMLLRNLDPKGGLLNGTRLIITQLGYRVIEAKILTGPQKGVRVFIPRITMTPSDSGLPFLLKRRQFPVRQSYAITINKSQGQTIPHVGVYLPVPVFPHGQLYVAVSRAKGFAGVKMSLHNHEGTDEEPFYTDNIVYKSVLRAV